MLKEILSAALIAAGLVSAAHADPERSYQGGRAAAQLPKVDDRGIEERAGAYLQGQGSGANTSFWNNNPNYDHPSTPTPSPTPSATPDSQPQNISPN